MMLEATSSGTSSGAVKSGTAQSVNKRVVATWSCIVSLLGALSVGTPAAAGTDWVPRGISPK